ncbi:acyltransferase family protein [Ciceribacter sp. L1K22]|uniref:acyltransferase family protein n=1 Tax=Ciceribacter sp. L1K22 TaxID=2820275 RepID=UPI001ABE9212|nr:acyltransferase family protein [Ciceribacter sp. L1K22]MBO3762220.1 acyltransferase [Ciceribacter sp. L1K22]
MNAKSGSLLLRDGMATPMLSGIFIPARDGFDHSINALRALAVTIVVLFHFQVAGFDFGFIGVDVFFVISGYLMTTIIFSGLNRRSFTLWSFYRARFTRIYPALATLCAVVLVGGYFLIPPFDYERIGNQIFAAALFYSNVVFWQQEGYFNTGSEYKMLLHTWSLSVEWQFYMIYPIALLVVEKVALLRRIRTPLLWAGFLLSLGLCIYASGWKPSAAFFLLPTRAWEMLLGGLLAVHRETILRNAFLAKAALYGGLALLLSMVVLHDGAWPNAYALLPTLGAALVIGSGHVSGVAGRFVPIHYLGLWSYSIYLWHWPVAVMMRFGEVIQDPRWIVVGLGLSVLLGFLSYTLVEVPAQNFFRRGGGVSKTALAAVLIGIPILSGVAVSRSGGMPARVSPEIVLADGAAAEMNPSRSNCLSDSSDGRALADCVLGTGPVKAFLMGDSHADAVATGLVEALAGHGSVRVFALSGCPSMVGVGSYKSVECGIFNRLVFKRLKTEDPSIPLVIVNRADYGPETLTNDFMAAQVASFDEVLQPRLDFGTPVENGRGTFACGASRYRKVFMLRPVPAPGSYLPRHVAYSLMWTGKAPAVQFSRTAYDSTFRKANRLIDRLAEDCGITPIDSFEAFCPPGGSCEAAPGGHPLFYDDNHLNEFGNKRLVPAFRSALLGSPS